MLFLVDGSNRLVVKEEAEQSSRGLIDVRVRCVCCGCDQKEVSSSVFSCRVGQSTVSSVSFKNSEAVSTKRFLCLAQSSLTCLAPHFEFERLRDDSDDYGLLLHYCILYLHVERKRIL